ncbi:MAG TPA: glycoside hydrolase family 3 N-terminal domain-containing protein [Candidatus Limnocylindrales bacterium]|nr:glycoside hydrolase family 3 N-terminal domain-containing protein [Candidatus Limnocylindrales bacterium]
MEAATGDRAPGGMVLGAVMLAFDGLTVPDEVARRLRDAPAAGVTLFRFSNVESPAQVRALTAAVQRAAGHAGPLLIAADQEGGQLNGLGDGVTPFAGNMALGAAGDPALTERVAWAVGLELRAMGVTIDYAPVCDLATNPRNPAVGIRSFGDEPGRVGEHVAAFVRGLQSTGVAAGLKHFPGLGGVVDDTHHRLAVLDASPADLDARELVPFRAGIDAGARVVMSAHLAVPQLTGDPGLPSTLSAAVMTDLLRRRLGFDGVSITDALNMEAIPQGAGQIDAVLAALEAGVDLLLTAPDTSARDGIERGLSAAAAAGLLDAERLRRSADRVRALAGWLAGFDQPDLSVVACPEHRALAVELASRSITLVRDDGDRIPLRPAAGARIAAIMPAPTDQTPADTSSIVPPGLARALRRHHAAVDGYVVGHAPADDEIAAVRAAVAGHEIVVVGTTAAHLEPGQAALVEALLEDSGADSGRVVTVALRTPFDLAAYPASRTHLSTYGILEPSLDALADVIFGLAPAVGRLPAAVPGLHPTGHGIDRR